MAKYQLKFDRDALKEWTNLDGSVKKEFLPILAKRLENPIVESARLGGELNNCFKIKSKRTGYRMIYTIEKNVLVVIVLAIGKRENFAAYKVAKNRLN